MYSSGVFIVSARRSPIGRMSGCLSGLSAHQLGGQVISSVLDNVVEGSANPKELKNHILEHLEEVIIGQVLTASAGQNPARQAAILAGIPYCVPAWCVNMMCGSGLKSVCLGFDRLSLSSMTDGGWILAGGQESMSQAPHATPPRACLRRVGGQNTSELPNYGNFTLLDTIMNDALMDAFCNLPMGGTAENVAKRFGISREEQDVFALRSQEKYAFALKAGYFINEITPIKVPGVGTEEPMMVAVDEHPRPDTTLTKLSKLRPAFHADAKNGTVTAGNASGVNDGAAFLLLCRGDQLSKLGSRRPLARIVGWHQAGLEPELMGLGPIFAIRGLLSKISWKIESVDIFEINEAFASQCIAIATELCILPEKLNVSGGAIALGHPVGCSGARILVTLVHTLQRICKEQHNNDSTTVRRGVAALCIGGGMGIAIAVETCV
ncbi:Acetyl-CoA acetyltransferase, cytosolic [Schistosoma japonicum]|uniref:Acetyl-CoA acetyltransferase, cytosolic n=1 Tax=Schistosoma japonicum TaxID=6182 RepID=A0A4Z2DV35_SCHJA|nr:Acetyl-CoA acetyltransferase, cytosolic [Schistosoma japonicum]